MNKAMNLQFFAESEEQTAQQSEQQETQEQSNQKSKTFTQQEVDEIVKERLARERATQEKAVSEAQKLAEMNAQQKAEYQRDKLQKQVDDLQREIELGKITKTARAMCADNDINISDDLLSVLVDSNAEKTKSAVEEFIKIFKEEVKKEVTNQIKGTAPRKGGTHTVTKEQIMAVKDVNERQNLIREHMDLFQS